MIVNKMWQQIFIEYKQIIQWYSILLYWIYSFYAEKQNLYSLNQPILS